MDMPTVVGSPAMIVISAIPLGSGNEYICTVNAARPGTFGTVHAYRGENARGEVHWHASWGYYDFTILGDALRNMITRAGITDLRRASERGE